jgi:hypothetical protein
MGSDRFFGAVISSVKEKGIFMGFKNKIITVALMFIAGLGVLSSGTCGRGHGRDFSSLAGPELASHTEREPAEVKVKNLRS